MLRTSILISLLSIFFFVSAQAQTVQNADTVMILPFENASGKPEFNWVGESFADALSDLLVEKEVKSSGLNVISNQERKIIQDSLKIPLTNIPSLATSIRIAQKAKANILVYGTYTIIPEQIIPEQDKIAASIVVRAKIIKVDEGKFLIENFQDGSRKMREIVLKEALADLQTVEAKVLVEVLRQLDRGLTIIENDVIKVATKVPAKAFEAYIKGLLTPESQLPTREGYFKNAMRLYSEAKAVETETDAKIYADVALELGHFYLNQKQYQNAITHFSQVISAVEKCNDDAKKVNKRAVCKDNEAAEAAFYTGLIYWQQENYEQALAVLTPLADDWKLTSVYNTLGAIAVEASRAEKKDKTKAANNLNRGLDFLKKASESDPDEIQSRFNYSVALFLTNDFSETIQQIRPVLAFSQKDGEAYYLLAKALEKKGDAAAVEFDTQARKYALNYAKLETEWTRAKTIEGLNLRVVQPPRKDFVNVVLIKKQNTSSTQNPVNETDTLLEQARAFFKAGKEDDAMQLLSRILAGDPMNAEAYLLRGKIFIKRINWDEAANQLRTALFYDNRLIEAHVILAKIFLEKKDCQQAQSYVASALAIDENDQDALGLQRQVERCSK